MFRAVFKLKNGTELQKKICLLPNTDLYSEWNDSSLILGECFFFLNLEPLKVTRDFTSKIELGRSTVVSFDENNEKPLQATGILEDNTPGWKIVRKMNSWPRSEASRVTVKC